MVRALHKLPNIEGYVMAIQRVEELLRKVAAALDAAGVPYAVIGGNAVAAWVASVDDGAVRATKDVDVLLRRADLPRAAAALKPQGFAQIEVLGVPIFVEEADLRPSRGVHVVLANERVKAHDPWLAPDVAQAQRTASGFLVLDLLSLVTMKLAAFRRVDQVHLEDLLRLGLVDAELAEHLPEDLRARLREVRDTMEWSGEPPRF